MENQYSIRIGNTNFIVSVKPSEMAKKPMDTAFRGLCVHEVLGDCFASDRFNLEEIKKKPLDKPSPEGTGFRSKTRFAKFYNLPELISNWKEAADIQTADMLNLPVPEAEYITVTTEPSVFQQEMVAELGERAEAVRNRLVDPSVDNMLRITSDGRKLALDQRLLNPMLPDNDTSKINACAENVLEPV